MRRASLTLLVCISAFAFIASIVQVPVAGAAQVIGTNATGVRLTVNAQDVAMITFRSSGTVEHLLARGAVNALAPSKARPQVQFELDATGGVKFYGKAAWKSFGGACRPYDGPALYGLVAACKGPDGSYWAVQSWQAALPDLGFAPWLAAQTATSLDLSHWSGPLPKLTVYQGWAQGHQGQIFGSYTYQGRPVYGFGTTRYGIPTDNYGRLVYVDAFGSIYGPGWFRENSFVSQQPGGQFCYALVRRNPRVGGYELPASWPARELRGPATGTSYRLVAQGPGVTPLVSWTGTALHKFDPDNPSDVVLDVRNRELLTSFGAGNSCLKGQVPPGGNMLLGLQDDFQSGTLSPQWNTPSKTGGATESTGSSGLTLSLPQGGASSVELDSSGPLDGHHSPAFIDLGPKGVPAGATFDLRLYPSLGPGSTSRQSYYGVRIAGGELETVRAIFQGRPPVWNGQAWVTPPPVEQDTVTRISPYDPRTMRWLYVVMQPVGNAMGIRTLYAADAMSTWTSFGSLTGISASAEVTLGLRASGDGSSDMSVNVLAVSR